ncbi:MAG: hypothetical protein IT307_05710 [Chloroflexi bacterium]|nr:hypothetical protein [Chloroflexota bacterium]
MKRLPLAGLAMAGLLVLAGALRLWHLWDIPSPTDELLGIGRGLSIARGRSTR